jgi:type I restriction enzyme M protein
MVTEADVPLLFSGGVYRVRVERPDELDPYLLLALLWSPIVRRQVRAKRFTRDVIDTLGRRFEEIVLPVPVGDVRRAIIGTARELMRKRIKLRKVVGGLGAAVEGAPLHGVADG